MPIIDVQVVQPASQPLEPGLAQRLADTIGRAWHAEPGHVWVRLHTLGADHYAENQSVLRDDELPVLVTVLLGELPASQDRPAHAAALAAAIAGVVARPVGRVHIEYALPGRGRLAFGGSFDG
jgi:phenylpyruvate tautomerase PptA (4-oxalocrotonate tautomerase family)